MRRKLLKCLITVLCFCFIGVCVTACGNGDLTLKDGSRIPSEVTAELGGVYIIPELKNDSQVVVSVKDSTGAEVRVNNHKFRIEDFNGYTITYSLGDKTATTKVIVTDTSEPVISVNVPENMVVVPNSEFNIPACSVSDMGSSNLTAQISVKDEAGNAVEVIDNKFVASQLGKYIITYTATDASGNTGKKELTIICQNADLLNDFETLECIGYISFDNNTEVVSENVANGNGIKITVDSDKEDPWRRIGAPLKIDGEYISLEKLMEYEKLQLYVYASDANELGLANTTWPIQKGLNVVTFTRAQIQAAYAFSDYQYKENGTDGFYLNLRYSPNGFSIVFDNFIGIYPSDYEPPQPENFTMEIKAADGIFAVIDKPFTPPECIVKDLEGNNLEYTYKITDADGVEMSLSDGKFTPSEIGNYKITYSITSPGFTGERSINFVAKKGVILNECSDLDDISGFAGFTAEKTLTDENTFNGQGIRLKSTSEGAWVQIYMMLRNESGDNLTLDELFEFEKIAFYVYAEAGSTLSISNGDPQISLSKGYNVVTFSMMQIMSAYDFSEWQYRPAEGFYLTIPAIVTGDCFVFDGATGIYSDDYESAPDTSSMTVKGIDGMTIILGKENILPPCTVTDSDGNPQQYTVTITGPDGTVVNSVDGKFVPQTLGQYTITYSASGFEDVTLTVNCKKGNVLNRFTKVNDITYINGNWFEMSMTDLITLTDSGIKVTAANANGNWANIYLPLSVNNKYISLAQLKEYEKLQFYVYITEGSNLLFGTGAPGVALTEGWNIVELSVSDMIANGLESNGMYTEGANGLIMAISNLAQGGHIVFDEIIGIYADDFTEDPSENPGEPEIPVAPEQSGEGDVLNAFETATDVTFVSGGACATEADEQGVRVTASTAAGNWANIFIPLMKDGSYLTLDQLKTYEKLRMVVYSTASCRLGLGSGNPMGNLTEGWNVVDLNMTDLIAGGLNSSLYSENANGLVLVIDSFPQGEFIIFNTMIGLS